MIPRGLVALIALFVVAAFGTCASVAHDKQITERACIAAGRSMWNDHCSYPVQPGETRVE